MKQIGLFLILLFLTLFSEISAQEKNNNDIFENITDIERLINRNIAPNRKSENFNPDNQVLPQDTSFYKRRLKGLQNVDLDAYYPRKENGTLYFPEKDHDVDVIKGLTLMDTIIINPLFLPMIFTGKILPPNLSFYPKTDTTYRYKGMLISQEKTFAPQLKSYDFVNQTRRNFYKIYPDRVQYSSLEFQDLPNRSEDKDVIETFNPFKELISTETSFSLTAPQIDGVKVKRKYWINNGEHSLQFSQVYFSPNWYKGGTSNFNILNNHKMMFNYRKDKVRFNNTFEWRLSLMTAPDDSLRSYRISDDLLRYFGDFGVDAFNKHWSYSTNLEARTQLFDNHPVNSNKVQSSFLAPLYLNGGLGLKYNLDRKSSSVRHRRVRLSFHFDPASFSFRYIVNDKVDKSRYGIEEGKNSKMDIGSTVTGNLIYDYNKYISLNSRMRYFTSYHKVEAELENTLNMALTNAFSTRIFLHLRYDDKVPADPKYKYLQVTQLLSFGLNYRW